VTTWRCAPGAASLRPPPERQPHPPCPLKAHRESGTLVESARSQGQLLTPADPSLTLTRTQRVATSGKPERTNSLYVREFASLCNARQHQTARSLSGSAVRVRSSALHFMVT
jgi:hypothetical protein